MLEKSGEMPEANSSEEFEHNLHKHTCKVKILAHLEKSCHLM